MKRLRGYVRRVLLEKARDYSETKRRTPESTRNACTDALNGTDTGWWNDLIYTSDVLNMAKRYRRDAIDAIHEFMAEMGTSASDPVRRGDDTKYYQMLDGLAWFTAHNQNDTVREKREDAAGLGIRFAIEFLAGEVARDLVPGL